MTLYITDKTGKRFWRTNVDTAWGIHNMHLLLQHVKAGHKGYEFIDRESARLVTADVDAVSDDELLAELRS